MNTGSPDRAVLLRLAVRQQVGRGAVAVYLGPDGRAGDGFGGEGGAFAGLGAWSCAMPRLGAFVGACPGFDVANCSLLGGRSQ